MATRSFLKISQQRTATLVTTPAPTNTDALNLYRSHSQSQSQSICHQAAVTVSTPVFWLCWWSVLVLRAATIVFVLCAAAVHLILSLPEAHDNTSALLLSIPLKQITGLSYLGVTVIHLTSLTQMVIQSVRHRRLVLQSIPRHSPKHFARDTTNADNSPCCKRARCLLGLLRYAWDQVFSSTGFLEILLQSYQLWSLSYSVSRVWINAFAVAAVVVNCWSIPLVNVMFHKREAIRRFMHVIVDMYLDFVCAVAVPVLILVPHVLAFNWNDRDFPAHLLVDDVWLANSVADGRQVLVTSYMDYFSSILPQYGIFSCLRLVKRMVKRRGCVPPSTCSSTVVPRSLSETASVPASTAETRNRRSRKAHGIWLVNACLVLWGIAMLMLHLRAQPSADNERHFHGCHLQLRPWFAANVSCSVMLIHCGHHNTTGVADDLAVILMQLERPVLTRLVFAHCPQLTVPSTIVEFPRLSGILVFNSTITSWPSSAAVTQSAHPMLVNIHIHKCDLRSGFPQGLLHSKLPATMANLVISDSALYEIPETAGNEWASSGLIAVRFHNTHLQTLPVSLAKLPLKRLSLSGNAIDKIDSDMFANTQFESLDLSGNPLIELPGTIGDTSRFSELFVEHTDVSTLPAWFFDWVTATRLDNAAGAMGNRVVSFFGSPVCDPHNNQAMATRLPLMACDRDWGTRNVPASYALIAAQYPIG